MLISVIIPVHDSGPYLARCLDSVLSQTVRDWEVIVVDDGSVDNSFAIATDCLRKFPHARLIRQENRGVSAARNLGLAVACGDWVSFVDSDDTIHPDYFETMLRNAEGTDCVVSGIRFLNGAQEERRSVPPDVLWDVDAHREKGMAYLPYMTSSFARLFKKSILVGNGICFNEQMSFAEDRDFNIEYLSCARRVRYISYTGYDYQTGIAGSLSKRNHPDQCKNDILYWRKVRRVFPSADACALATMLYHILVDSFSVALKDGGLSRAVQLSRTVRPLVDRAFLAANLDRVQAPLWQKRLVRLYLW